MPYEKEGPKPVFRRSTSGLQPGQPIQVSDPIEVTDGTQMSSLCVAMAETLGAYSKAGRELLAGQYASVRDLAPPHLRVPCHIYVVCCPDGVIVRYDAAGEDEPKVRYTDHHQGLAEAAPGFSEQVIHVPDDPATYVPKHLGPGIIQMLVNERGEAVEHGRLHPVIYAPKSLPADFVMPPPPARPPCLASIPLRIGTPARRHSFAAKCARQGDISWHGSFRCTRVRSAKCRLASSRNISSAR